MTDASKCLGQSYAQLKQSAVFGIGMPEPESIGDVKYVAMPLQGVSFVLGPAEEVCAVQLHSEGHEEFSAFQGPLPAALRFTMSRRSVRQLLGPPAQSGEPQALPGLGDMPAWDSYATDTGRLHIEYEFDESRIRLVSLIAE